VGMTRVFEIEAYQDLALEIFLGAMDNVEKLENEVL